MKECLFMVSICILSISIAYTQDSLHRDRKFPTITLHTDNTALSSVFTAIWTQTRYGCADHNNLLRLAKNVTVDVINEPLDKFLIRIFKDQPLTFKIRGRIISIKRKEPPPPALKGMVTDNFNNPIRNVTISLNNRLSAITDFNGRFFLPVSGGSDTISFSAVGYTPQSIIAKSVSDIQVQLLIAPDNLSEITVIGYTKVVNKLGTGTTVKVSHTDIEHQPVGNVLSTISGRAPGLVVIQANGLPGSAHKLQLRGQGSIGISPGSLPLTDPLILINGIPLASNNNSIQAIPSGSALGSQGRSALASINPFDIENIVVLKDADATAIYGSRGANGVILFTTKEGKPGPPTLSLSLYKGWSKVRSNISMLNTPQYVSMRREAMLNDGQTPNHTNAADLFAWDTTRNTDLKKKLIGGTATITDVQVSISGGGALISYLLSTSLRRETTVFPGNFADNRASLHAQTRYNSRNKKFVANWSTLFSSDINQSFIKDITNGLQLPPNVPPFYDSTGKLTWKKGNLIFNNPYAYLQQQYISHISNFLTRLLLSYQVSKALTLKTNIGYNGLSINETSLIPGSSLNPNISANPQGSAFFSNGSYKSWIIEPQAEYETRIAGGKLAVLVGSTLQESITQTTLSTATGYSNDDRLLDTTAAAIVKTIPTYKQYKYQSIFSRINYNIQDKYHINAVVRIDGSSRFGPEKQFGTFWSLGGAWIFSKESFFKENLSFISFGKLRTSYGITGNDQISDYKFLDNWIQPNYTYLGGTVLIPDQLADPTYSWELCRKLESAIDLEFFNSRLGLTLNYYRNRTGNQLISYPLPSTTGFNNIAAKNSNAVVQNSGWEIMLKSTNLSGNNHSWKTEGWITFPRNKLLSFPELKSSRYSAIFTEGKSLTTQNGYHYTGINPQTGLFEFEDVNGDGKLSYLNDYKLIGHLDPVMFGALRNTVTFENWQLDILLEGKKQKGFSNLYLVYNGSGSGPGHAMANQPALVINRWQKPGDNASLQRFTTGTNAAANTARSNFLQSDSRFEDLFFIRLTNISLVYTLPSRWCRWMHMKNSHLYFESQNLLTISNYKGLNPETQAYNTLPPLSTIAIGIKCNF